MSHPKGNGVFGLIHFELQFLGSNLISLASTQLPLLLSGV